MRISVRMLALLIFTAILCWPQSAQPGTEIGGEMIRLGMNRERVSKILSGCCNPVPFGDGNIFVRAREGSSPVVFGGTVYFGRDGKVSGIAADRYWSPEQESSDPALAFYRLVDSISHGKPAQVTIYTRSLEFSNGTTKFVVIEFGDGRRVRFEIVNPDEPGANLPQQMALSECLGNCADWCRDCAMPNRITSPSIKK
jgi:hypothetical protein